MPFDRLIRTVDLWAAEEGRTDVVAQTGPSDYVPTTLRTFQFLGPDEFRQLLSESELVIAHAGIGSILSSLECGKPVVVMPRDHTRGEHRNAHQLGTADRFRGMPGVYVVDEENALRTLLDQPLDLVAGRQTCKKASGEFVHKLREFIDDDDDADSGASRHIRQVGSIGRRVFKGATSIFAERARG